MRATIAPPRPLARQITQRPSQRTIILAPHRLVTLSRTMLTDDQTRPTLRQAKTALEGQDPSTSTRRAQKFPSANTFSATFSSSLSATIAFNVWFSRSSSFNRRTSLAFIPPNCARHR